MSPVLQGNKCFKETPFKTLLCTATMMCTFMKREETDRNGDSTLVYGEITFKTLALALHKVKKKYGLPGVGSSGKEGVLQCDGGAFYDIGSGTGKPVRSMTCVFIGRRVVV